MKKIWFWRILLVVSFVVTLSGCKVVMEYRLDDCDPTATITDSSDTKNDAVLKHGTGNTDGLSAQYSFDSSSDDSYVVCANRWFRGEGYNTDPNNSWYAAKYYIEAADHDDISPLSGTLVGIFGSTKEMTLAGWFKSNRSNGTIISKAGSSSNSREYRVFLKGETLKVTFWNQYGSPETFTVASSVADNAWHAFAVTAKISGHNLLVKKYLDGDYKGSENRHNFNYCTNTSGSLIVGAMQWGESSITDYFDGYIDELVMTDDVQNQNDLKNSYQNMKAHKNGDGRNRTCPSCSVFDHYRIEHTGIGLTCQRANVVVRVCTDAACSSEYADPVTITLTPTTANPPTWIGGDTQTFTGHQVFQLRQTLPGAVALGLTNTDPVPTNDYQCFDSGVEGDCDIVFHDTGFIFDVPDLTSCQTSSDVAIQAVRTDETTQTCVADGEFANANKIVNFWSSYIDPATGTEQVSLSGTNVAASSPGTGISLNFDATATANFTVNYPDAGQMQLDARYDGVDAEGAGLIMLGADSFTVRPVSLCVYSDDVNADCSSDDAFCSVFKKVDESFNLKVKGVCWQSSGDADFCSGNSTTGNFRLDSIPITQTLIAPTSTGSSSGNIGITSIDILAADNGEHVISNQTVSEVGVYTFTVTPPDYFGSPLPVATSTNIGRFTPDHFVTSIVNNGIFQDGCSGFTYSGQPFSYVSAIFPKLLITAVGSAGNTTVNYRDDFVKLTDPATQISMPAVTSDVSHFGADGSTLLNLAWTPAATTLYTNDDGTLNFTLGDDRFVYTRDANALVAPFNSDIQLPVNSVTDSDTVTATDLPRSFVPAGTEIRYGRMQLQNAYGPETLPLTIPVLTEYYSGSSFTLNSLDSCSTYNSSNLLLNNYQENLTSGETTASGSGTLLSGIGNNLSLSAPGVGNDGSVDLTLDLSQATGANMEWLRPNGSDPTAKVTFGIFKGNNHLIYMRESIW